MLAFIIVAWIVRDERRRQKRRRFNSYMNKLHTEPVSIGTTLAHFWLGQFYVQHGTKEQLDDWYRLTHGYPNDC